MLTTNGVIVTTASYLLYRERITAVQMLGMSIILVSICVIALTSRKDEFEMFRPK